MIDKTTGDGLGNAGESSSSNPSASEAVMTKMSVPEGVEKLSPQEAWKRGYVAGVKDTDWSSIPFPEVDEMIKFIFE